MIKGGNEHGNVPGIGPFCSAPQMCVVAVVCRMRYAMTRAAAASLTSLG